MDGLATIAGLASGMGSKTQYYNVGFGDLAGSARTLATTIFWPAEPVSQQVWFCLPGGGMNRQFYDLQGREGAFSFARQMAARGYVCVLVDPPGIGDSDRPDDGHALTLQRITSALTHVREQVCADLQTGRIAADLPALEQVRTIGLGHSMGAMLTVLQQADARQHAALALLGFGLQGLPDYLPDTVKALASNPLAVRQQLGQVARAMFPAAWPDMSGGGNGDFYGNASAERDAVVALKAARDRLLPVPATLSIVPGNVAAEARNIAVPVRLVYGSADFIGPSDDAACGFTASVSVSQQTLPHTGHSFFLFNSRTALFDDLAAWAGALDN